MAVTRLEEGMRDTLLRLMRRARLGKDPELKAELVRLVAGVGAADDLLSIAAASKLTSWSPSTIRRRIKTGAIRGYGSGKLLRVRRGDLERAIESGRRTPEPDLSPERLADLADQEDGR